MKISPVRNYNSTSLNYAKQDKKLSFKDLRFDEKRSFEDGNDFAVQEIKDAGHFPLLMGTIEYIKSQLGYIDGKYSFRARPGENGYNGAIHINFAVSDNKGYTLPGLDIFPEELGEKSTRKKIVKFIEEEIKSDYQESWSDKVINYLTRK